MVRYQPQIIGIIGASLKRGHKIFNEYMMTIPAEMVLKLYRYRNGTRVLLADGGFIETLLRNAENWREGNILLLLLIRKWI